MNKLDFLNRFKAEDKVILSNIYDKITLSTRINKTIYSNEFYSPSIWSGIKKLSRDLEVEVSYSGIFEDSERRMLAFSKDAFQVEFPQELIKIQNKSKFNELTHRDYLGAIMSLGIERNKFGDLVLDENSCYAAVSSDITQYIMDNLTEIGRCPCELSIINLKDAKLPNINFMEFNIIATSLRLDCIVSSICKLSRNKALELINSSNVSVDYVVNKEKDYNVPFGSTITVRGYGKYKIEKEIGITSRERIKLLMKKFV